MDFKKLKIGNSVIVNGNVAFTTQFIQSDDLEGFNNIDFFKNLWKNKRLLIVGDNYTLEADIKEIQSRYSFLGTRYMDILTSLTEIGDIKANDLVMVID